MKAGPRVLEEVVDVLPDLNNTDPLTPMMNEPEGTNPNEPTRIQPSVTFDGDTAETSMGVDACNTCSRDRIPSGSAIRGQECSPLTVNATLRSAVSVRWPQATSPFTALRL